MSGGQKITFGEMRQVGATSVEVFCRDFKCAHAIKLHADSWLDEMRLYEALVQRKLRRDGIGTITSGLGRVAAAG